MGESDFIWQLQPSPCWSMGVRPSGSFWGDSTVPADYSMTTTTSCCRPFTVSPLFLSIRFLPFSFHCLPWSRLFAFDLAPTTLCPFLTV